MIRLHILSCLLLSLAVESQYVGTNDYAVQSVRISLVSRLSFRIPQPDLDNAPEGEKVEYFRKYFFNSPDFPLNIIKFHNSEGGKSTLENISPNFSIQVLKNEALGKAYTSLSYRYTSLMSIENAFNVGLSVKGTSYLGKTTTIEGSTPNTKYF